MARTIGIGKQDFRVIRERNCFYVDKTAFIKEWWETEDSVTLITRPRRFGKTLTMSMVEQFFSVKYKNRGDLFEGLSIWEEEKYRSMQGTFPVISLTFANVKATTFQSAKTRLNQILADLYSKHIFLMEGDLLTEEEKQYFRNVTMYMEEPVATLAIHRMSDFLSRYYGKNVIILLDEYDTPMQEAYVNGYWKEMVAFIRSMFHAAFKTNPHLERAIMTGITRVSKESIFSDLNNLKVVTTTSEKYEDCFGFTEQEVFAALDEFGLSEQKQIVKYWYDGFTFGNKTDIYNPWSVINFLDDRKVGPYWANTSSNSLISKLVREGNGAIKETIKDLINGEIIRTEIDEQIVYGQLDLEENAIWSLFLASGYLKVKHHEILSSEYGEWKHIYELGLTNFEVKVMFRQMIRGWFASESSSYNSFIKAMLQDDVEAMNYYMNKVSFATFSYFDVGADLGNRADTAQTGAGKPEPEESEQNRSEPERFYHGFVLGLMVSLTDEYEVLSNRESGFGRYDVMLKPRDISHNAYIFEFKVFQPGREKDLQETVKAALKQIEEKQYAKTLIAQGILERNIRKYGFAFSGKKVLIGDTI